jgi:hypothetical protein
MPGEVRRPPVNGSKCSRRAPTAAPRRRSSRDRPGTLGAAAAAAEYRLGEWDDAVVHGDLAVSLVEHTDQLWYQPFAHCIAALVWAATGRLERGRNAPSRGRMAAELLGDQPSHSYAANAAIHLAFCLPGLAGHHRRRKAAIRPELPRGPVRARRAAAPAVEPPMSVSILFPALNTALTALRAVFSGYFRCAAMALPLLGIRA